MIFVNFKSTHKGVGENAENLVYTISQLQLQTNVDIVPVVHDLDAYRVRRMYKGDIWLQHADFLYGGTGDTSIETISDLDYHIDGVFLNHSEHRYPTFDTIANSVIICRKFKIKCMIFAAIEGEVERACQMNPDYVAYEPP